MTEHLAGGHVEGSVAPADPRCVDGNEEMRRLDALRDGARLVDDADRGPRAQVEEDVLGDHRRFFPALVLGFVHLEADTRREALKLEELRDRNVDDRGGVAKQSEHTGEAAPAPLVPKFPGKRNFLDNLSRQRDGLFREVEKDSAELELLNDESADLLAGHSAYVDVVDRDTSSVAALEERVGVLDDVFKRVAGVGDVVDPVQRRAALRKGFEVLRCRDGGCDHRAESSDAASVTKKFPSKLALTVDRQLDAVVVAHFIGAGKLAVVPFEVRCDTVVTTPHELLQVLQGAEENTRRYVMVLEEDVLVGGVHDNAQTLFVRLNMEEKVRRAANRRRVEDRLEDVAVDKDLSELCQNACFANVLFEDLREIGVNGFVGKVLEAVIERSQSFRSSDKRAQGVEVDETLQPRNVRFPVCPRNGLRAVISEMCRCLIEKPIGIVRDDSAKNLAQMRRCTKVVESELRRVLLPLSSGGAGRRSRRRRCRCRELRWRGRTRISRGGENGRRRCRRREGRSRF